MTAIQAQSVNAHPFAKFAEEVLNFIRGADFSRFSRLRYEQQRESTLNPALHYPFSDGSAAPQPASAGFLMPVPGI